MKYTNIELEVFEKYGFKLVDNDMKHDLGHIITKVERALYNVLCYYPKSYPYKALSYPYASFATTLDIISKFERYYENPDRHNVNLIKTIY
jgi:hypothetical protein